MSASAINPVADAVKCLERADFTGAERIALAVTARGPDADALHVLGLVRLQQGQLAEAAALLEQSLAVRPGHAHVLLNLGKVLMLMDQTGEAREIFSQAVAAEPRLAEAWFELGEINRQSGDFAAVEAPLRRAMALAPEHRLAQLSLGIALKDAGRAAEAESLLAGGLSAARDSEMRSAYAHNLAFSQYEQGKKEEALANFALAAALDPSGREAELSRADLLEEMLRLDEAVAVLEDVLQRDPGNAKAHMHYNELLYRLGRDEDFLKSYDQAPASPALVTGKAGLLLKTGRLEEAAALFDVLALRDPANLDAAIGGATTLQQLGRHDAALARLERAAKLRPDSPDLFQNLASAALMARDPEKAAAMAEQSLRLAPLDQSGLAVLGTAWRMMGDERDEMLNGYDELIGIFDLEPPAGFSSMAEFNAELNHWLDRMHPMTREPLTQSLRSGSQTRGHIFGQGHVLADKLKVRIAEAVNRFIASAKPDPRHPFRGRRARDFRFTGSWSSRLKDCGFHINHIHPGGWISSCYYVGVPEAVKDETKKQGWITFGQPNFDVGLPVRRAIQPEPGRLVLFPSYMWHGTVPFRSSTARTTIAFDAVPLA
jgi:tetratricopeptide (TPR) repeat protein